MADKNETNPPNAPSGTERFISVPDAADGSYVPVIIESPYSGNITRNVEYARACMLDCLNRGEAPFASHLLYTQSLNDGFLPERLRGIEAGFAWRKLAAKTVVYEDLGISEGMRQGIRHAESIGHLIEFRRIRNL